MNKSALKTFAISARKELLKKVEARAMKIGVTENNLIQADIESSDAIFIDGKQLSKEEEIQRDKLIARINQIGFKQVIEEVAYTWFNRFTALRYMEVNEYLPTDVRVLSSTNPDSAEPDMISDALSLELEIDKEYVYEMKLKNKTDELFKYLIIKHCNDLNRYLPFMFETIDDYTEILFPEGLLAKDSFILQMTNIEIIPEDNWEKVEIIGWLYQYYISERKDLVIQAKKKYKTEEIPFATQLFTPEWIVRYMVQNSLGRYWVESHPEHQDLLIDWEFFLKNPNPESDFEEKLAPYINKELRVEDIKCFDPAMGSGHILVYMFDILYEIYSKCGYMEKEIPRLIIENNLYGLDIDDRAYQLACFSVVMKALKYNNRFFRTIEREGLILNLASIQETNTLNDEDIAYIAGNSSGKYFTDTKEFILQFQYAKSIGSLVKVNEYNKEFLETRLTFIKENPANDLFEEEVRRKVVKILADLIKQSSIISQQYDVLVTNPPYMGSKYMKDEVKEFLNENYKETKADLFTAFMEYSMSKVNKSGHIGMVTPYLWMFLNTYKNFRKDVINNTNISSLVQLEYNAFEVATVPVCTFTLRNNNVDVSGQYIKLSDFKGSENQPLKTLEAVEDPSLYYRYTSKMESYQHIPNNSIAYWVSEKMVNIFKNFNTLNQVALTRMGLVTGNGDRFLRFWHEVNFDNVNFDVLNNVEAKNSPKRWFPYQKGGAFRRWYGNLDYIVNWENDGYEMRYDNSLNGRVRSHNYNGEFGFREGITWSDLTTGNFASRYVKKGFMFDSTGPMMFLNDSKYMYFLLGYCNSKVFQTLLDISSQGFHYTTGAVSNVSLKIFDDKEVVIVENMVKDNIEISKENWDSFETSWDFKRHALLSNNKETRSINKALQNWINEFKYQSNIIKKNEEDLNEIFIKLYNLENEISPNVNDKDITLRKVEKEKAIKSFISYSVGCMLGRYSLDKDGIIFAGGDYNNEQYRSFKSDEDNILPILPGTYFEDDIVSKFIDFVRVTFTDETMVENLDFIADNLGKKKGETAKETIRRYFLNDFFKDHVQTYKKRPIYWLFTSGKQKAFNCLIYMHRYDKTTLSRIRTDYLHEFQIRLDGERKSLVNIINNDSTTREISDAKKELKTVDKKIEELKEFDEILHHMADKQIDIDLNDGVTVNYEKFKGLVAKI